MNVSPVNNKCLNARALSGGAKCKAFFCAAEKEKKKVELRSRAIAGPISTVMKHAEPMVVRRSSSWSARVLFVLIFIVFRVGIYVFFLSDFQNESFQMHSILLKYQHNMSLLFYRSNEHK